MKHIRLCVILIIVSWEIIMRYLDVLTISSSAIVSSEISYMHSFALVKNKRLLITLLKLIKDINTGVRAQTFETSDEIRAR